MKKALLIFAKQPLPGEVKTRLCDDLTATGAAALYRCMLGDVLARTSMLPVDRFLVYQKGQGAADFFRELCPELKIFPQEGEALGERLANAFDTAFGGGYGAVAAIGTDAPDLPMEYLVEAFTILEEGRADVVFGPAEDGGYYLVSMGRPCPGIFADIPWSTPLVLEKSESVAVSLGIRTARLPFWHDIDMVSDIGRLSAGGRPEDAPRTWRFLRENGLVTLT